MATGKRYYWMKLKDSFMTSDTIDYFMSQPDGANYVVLYQMLCLKTINTDGRLSRQIGEIIIPYDIPKIQRDLKWFTADTIRVALELFKAFGLIYEDVDGTLVLADHDSLVGSETDWSAKKRRQRNTPELPGGDNVPTNVPQIVPTEKEIRERDKRLEIEKDIEIEIEDDSCAEPQSASAPPVVSMILNDGTYFDVSEEDFEKWSALYPAVDVMRELRKMVGWCDANPKKRKTKRGIRAFINSWLAKEQDFGKNQTGRGMSAERKTGNIFMEMLREEEERQHGSI